MDLMKLSVVGVLLVITTIWMFTIVELYMKNGHNPHLRRRLALNRFAGVWACFTATTAYIALTLPVADPWTLLVSGAGQAAAILITVFAVFEGVSGMLQRRSSGYLPGLQRRVF